MKTVFLVIVCLTLCSCGPLEYIFDEHHSFGPGTIKQTMEVFEYDLDNGSVFETQSSLYYASSLQGKHCDHVSISMDIGYVERIKAEGCKP